MSAVRSGGVQAARGSFGRMNTTTTRRMLNKVPEVTLYFWVIKILCTTVGETAADYLNENLGFGLTNTTYLVGALLIAALVYQFRARKYVPGIYWLAVVLISVVGTLITDNLVDNFGVAARDHDDRVLHRARRDLRGVVPERAHPLDPHDRHDPARGLLLARDPLHLRARHGRRRPRGGAPRPRVRAVGADLRRADRRRRGRPLPLPAQRGAGVLARLHPHPPAGRLDRRLHVAAHRGRRPRPRDDRDERHLPRHDPRARDLPHRHAPRRDRAGRHGRAGSTCGRRRPGLRAHRRQQDRRDAGADRRGARARGGRSRPLRAARAEP